MDYYRITEEELGKDSKIPIVKLGETGEVFYQIAMEMIDVIKKKAEENKECIMIVPVGPVGQYSIFSRLVNTMNLSLKHVTFINMDEYLTDDKKWISKDDPLSFRGFMDREVYSKIKPELLMPEEQRIFPDPENLDVIPKLLEEKGIDLCIGGIGITGHIAFNEPENVTSEEYLNRETRIIEIAPETRTTNSIGDLNGALEDMPTWAVTIGFKEIFAAKKIRLYVFRDWHRGVIRRAGYTDPSGNFPVSILQNHKDTTITTNNVASKKAI